MALLVTVAVVAFVLGLALGDTIKLQRTKEEELDRAWASWATRHRAHQRTKSKLRQFQSRSDGTPAA